MVMKKLFQRNRDLEDQVSNTNVSLTQHNQTRDSYTPERLDLDEVQVGSGETRDSCRKCVEVRKEMAEKESAMQERIQELQALLLKKTEAIGKASH